MINSSPAVQLGCESIGSVFFQFNEGDLDVKEDLEMNERSHRIILTIHLNQQDK